MEAASSNTEPFVDQASATLMRVGRYELLAVRGRGSFSSVWLAADRAGGQFALKLWDAELSGAEGAGARLAWQHECAVLARLRHPHIVPLLDQGLESQGLDNQNLDNLGLAGQSLHSTQRPWLAMPWLEGCGIDAYARRNCLCASQCAELIRQAAIAVQHAHDQQILHCDLKPAHMLIDVQGKLTLIDFGAARSPAAHAAGQVRGDFTPGYAAPEQIAGAILSPASDVYSLGVVLRQLLTPKHRTTRLRADAGAEMAHFDAPGQVQAAQQRMPSSSDAYTGAKLIDAALEPIVLRCLEPAPEARFQSAQALAHALGEYCASTLPGS